MKTNALTSETLTQNANLWVSFIEYMDQLYFDGATELLEKELVAYEYNQFVEIFAA